jgi:DNA invertase Pin-like site-specific DNA recombinase
MYLNHLFLVHSGMDVVLYARVSTKDKGQDCENQLAELRTFVSKKASDGWKLKAEYVDHASGKSDDRPGFRNLFADASKKRFDLVLFWSLDRFSREGVLETLQHLQRLTSHGVDWFSYQEEYLRSIGVFRDAVLAVLATVAKQERIRISERVQAGLNRARAEGKQFGRPRCRASHDRIRDLRATGLSIRAISEAVGASPMTVHRVLAGSTQTPSTK